MTLEWLTLLETTCLQKMLEKKQLLNLNIIFLLVKIQMVLLFGLFQMTEIILNHIQLFTLMKTVKVMWHSQQPTSQDMQCLQCLQKKFVKDSITITHIIKLKQLALKLATSKMFVKDVERFNLKTFLLVDTYSQHIQLLKKNVLQQLV